MRLIRISQLMNTTCTFVPVHYVDGVQVEHDRPKAAFAFIETDRIGIVGYMCRYCATNHILQNFGTIKEIRFD